MRTPDVSSTFEDLRDRLRTLETRAAKGAGAPDLLAAELRDAVEALVAAETAMRRENEALAADRDRSQNALIVSEARLRAILASTLDPVVTIDASGVIQSASNSIERVLGWKPEDLIGANVSRLMPEPHQSRHDDYLAMYRKTGETNILGRTREFEALHADGRHIPIDLSVARVDLPGSDDPLFTGILHDVTERRENEAQLRLIQSLALSIGAAKDLEDAMAVALQRICAATGCAYGEAWIPDEENQVLLRTPIRHAADPGLAVFQQMTQGSTFRKGEGLPGRTWASREAVWVNDLSAAAMFARAGSAGHAGLRAAVGVPLLVEDEVVAVIAFFMKTQRERPERFIALVSAAAAPLGPLIQRKRVEAALAESERRLREMLRSVELVAVTLNRGGTVTFCNDYLLSLTGWTRGEVVGRNWFEQFVPEDEREAVAATFREVIESGTIRSSMENAILTRDGERRMIAWNNSILRDVHGVVVGATGLGVDISERRRHEEELARYREHLETLVAERTRQLEQSHDQLRVSDRLASIGTLVAGLGHDMNNVLLPVRSRLEVLAAIDLPPRVREHFTAICHSIEYLQQLTDGLHLLALDPDDPHASSDESTDLAAWWDRAGPLLRRVAPSEAVFESSFRDDLPPVAAAPHRLSQAVLNLVVNASEVLPAERGHIRVAATVADDGDTVRLSVRDNGTGMTPDVRRRALDPFFTTKKRGLGTGLGLSLVHGVAKAAGGTVHIDSEVGRGTEVTMILPARRRVQPIAAGRVPGAVVSLADARIASLVETMLRTAGLDARRDRGPDPDRDDVWVVDADDLSFESAREFLSRTGRRVIACGPDNGGWVDLDVLHVPEPDDFEQLRDRIAEAVRPFSESTP